MKQRSLPFVFLSLLVLGLTAYLVKPADAGNGDQNQTLRDGQQPSAVAYLASIRNNQHTGLLDPQALLKAREEAAQLAQHKSGGKSFTWVNIGPDNIGGRTRAVLFDNRDASGSTIYAGNVTGGLFKSTNGGGNWQKTNLGGVTGLNVSTMVQHSNGTIYVGTGEGFNVTTYTGSGEYGDEGGFIGKGIFVSDDNDNFHLIESTQPYVTEENVVEWGYINSLALDEAGNRIFAATNTGLKVASLNDLSTWNTEFKHRIDSTIVQRTIAIDSIVMCDSFGYVDGSLHVYGSLGWNTFITANDTTDVEVVYSEYVPFESQENCSDVKVSQNGWVIATFNDLIYVSTSGKTDEFVLKSVYPENEENVRKDQINWSAHYIIKDKQGNVLLDSLSNTVEEIDWHTDYYEDYNSSFTGYPSGDGAGRTVFAIAPSDQNIVYAQVTSKKNTSRNALLGIYMSADGGETWRTVAPGGSSLLNIMGGVDAFSGSEYKAGDYASTIAVSPTDPYKVLAGGVDLWVGTRVSPTGYYAWEKASVSDATILQDGIFDDWYCHRFHHAYAFNPTNGSKFLAATSGGIFSGKIGANGVSFQSLNKNYITAQFYSLDISTRPVEYIGGTQDNGVLYNSGKGGTGMSAVGLWRPSNFDSKYIYDSDGGAVAFSTVRSIGTDGEEVAPPSFYTTGPFPNASLHLYERFRRSETIGFDFSATGLISDIDDNRFISPMLLWESYNDTYSQFTIPYVADANHDAGDSVVVRSSFMNQPFYHVLTQPVSQGDTVEVQDIFTSRLFIGIEDEVYMSLNSSDFAQEPSWYLISSRLTNGVDGFVQSMAASTDGNYLWVGTTEGKLYRISGIAFAYDEEHADVNSTDCVIATVEVMIGEENTQAVTSIAVDPSDNNKVLITLGNMGNTDYVWFCQNGTADMPEFTSVQGNLPAAPAYSCLLEMDPVTDVALVGTELGLFATDDITSGEWYVSGEEIGQVPVMAIKQQTLWKNRFVITITDPVTGEKFYEIFPEPENYKDIYVATYGRGVFKYDTDAVGIEERPAGSKQDLSIQIYPNPASNRAVVSVNMTQSGPVVVEMYDLSGRLAATTQAELSAGMQSIDLNLGTLPKGTYLVRVIAGNMTGNSKLVILK